MALFKSQILTQASGSVGGMTYTRTPSGMVIRAKSMPVNPSTPLQQVSRVAMSTLSTRWVTTLTEEQREGWAFYAAGVARKNKLGDQIYLAPNAMYIRCNSPRVQAGMAPVDDAPTEYTCGEPVQFGQLNQDETTPFTVMFSFSESEIGVNDYVLLYLSRPTNASVNFFKGPYRYAQRFNNTTADIVLTPGDGWVAGNKIHARAQITYADGRLSPSTEYQLVLAATPV